MAEPVRFYLDEHIASLILHGLRQRAIDALSVEEAGRAGLQDPEQFDFAAKEKRVIVTFDADYLQLASSATDHYGVAYCHATKYSPNQLLQLLVVLHGVMDSDEMRNHVEFL